MTIKNHVMVANRAAVNKDNPAIREIVMRALDNIRSGETVQKGFLMQSHERFGHLRYGIIGRLAHMSESGI